MVLAGGLEEAAIAGVANQCLVAVAQLALQRGQDSSTLGGIFLRLLVVDADDVALAAQLDRLGAVVDVSAALLDHQRHEGRGIAEHDLAYQLVGAFAHAEDVEQTTRFQCGDGLGTDHAAVSDDAEAADGEAPAQPIDHRHQVVTSAVLPGHISEHTGRPSPSITTARIICRRSGRWSLL